MVRFSLLLVGLLFGLMALGGQDLGRTDSLWREYLSETVRRGLPLLNNDPHSGVVPFWPRVDRLRSEAASLEPGPDLALLSSWIDLQEGAIEEPLKTLRESWPSPALGRFAPRQWGEALFSVWPGTDPAWTQAWLAWEDKAYSPVSLVRGLEVLERTDPSAVVPLLGQALRLYPEDRRFLALVARNPEVATSAEGLIARDLALSGGFSSGALRALLTRSPRAKDLLIKGGYPTARIEAALGGDYGTWLLSGAKQAPADGAWTWDSDQDGLAESTLTFQSGRLATWTRTSDDGSIWTLGFADGKPQTVTETRDGATWTLNYEAYPWATTLEYHWGGRTLVYRFRPLAQAVPLWPAERFSAPMERLPAALAQLWLPLDPRALVQEAATVETWEGSFKINTVFLSQGEVWLEVEDSNRDGRDDTWSYFRSGRLVSIYRDVEGRGQVGLRELYKKGELAQVQTRSTPGPRAEFALFPAEGVQLWDPKGSGRPLERIFVWSGGERMDALVFSGDALPWETMPPWAPRP